MEVLEEFDMSKMNSEVFKYPVVIRSIGSDFFISVPDLGFWKEIKIPSKTDIKNSSISAIFDSEIKKLFMDSLVDVWTDIDQHLKTKKWIPDPSQIKESLQTPEEDFTLPEFTKKLNMYISISENTVRREIRRDAIQCYQTEGGHRRIPYSELQRYISVQKNTLNNQTII
jgi:excisionase family DNA binding protein